MRPEQELAERNNQASERNRLIDMAAKLIMDTAAGTPTERAELAATFLREASGPEPFAASPMTGSTLYLIERDQWKERALAAESRLGRVESDLAERIAVETALRNRLDPVRESEGCVVDNIDRLNFEVSELKRTNQILVRRLGALALTWTKDQPTVPGHYWNRQEPPNEDIVTIRAVFSIERGDGSVTFYADGPGLRCSEVGGEWAGPMHPPGMPTAPPTQVSLVERRCTNFVGPHTAEAADPRDRCVTCCVPFENHPRGVQVPEGIPVVNVKAGPDTLLPE